MLEGVSGRFSERQVEGQDLEPLARGLVSDLGHDVSDCHYFTAPLLQRSSLNEGYRVRYQEAYPLLLLHLYHVRVCVTPPPLKCI